jgi:nucleoside 2-deoxyribosyltransferase
MASAMTPRRTVYLAGPDVFLPDADAIGRRKKQLCADHGFEGLYPLDEPPVAGAAPLDRLIYRGCVAMLRRADFAIVHLTPFRGVGADVGTAVELGMLVALGKPVFGYTNLAPDLLTRVQAGEVVARDAAGIWRDSAGMMVEDFGNADNLMIDAALAEQGEPLVRVAAPWDRRFHDLTGFEACLARAVARFG